MQTVRIPGIGDVDFPDDMSHDQIAHAIEKEILPNYKAPTGGIVESAIGSAKRGMISAGTALKAPFGAEEAAKAGVEAEQAVTERPGFNWDEIKRKYEQEGLMPAAGEAISQIPGTVSEQAPTLASILAGGRVGAMGGGELGGMIGGPGGALIGATIGGIGGAAAYPFLTQSGENIQRQYQEQVAKGETPDISLGKAYGAGAFGTALEMALGPEAFLAKRVGKKTAEQIAQEELQSLAKQGMVQGALRGTGRVMAEEIPTEMAQTALTRLQAGLPISPADQQALDEYLASGVGAALAGPVGGPMRIMESGAARATLAEQERKRQEEEAKKAEEDRIASLYGGQRTLPGFEGVEPQLPKTEEEISASSLERAADYLRGLPQDFTNPSQVKKALEGTEFETVGPKKALDLYKTLPVQTQLFDEEGNLSAPAMQGYGQRQKAGEAMGKKLEQAQPGETLDLFGKAAPITYQQEQPEAELPSQGGSANLMMQQAMKEAEQQTAIDQANRARQTLYGQPEVAPMGYESAERRARAIEESLPHQQRTLELQQQLQQQALAEQQKKAGEAMGKKLEQAKPGQTLDIFGKAHEADFTQPEAAQEIPSQGGSANLQIQEAIRQAELANDIEKANRLRQQLYATPEGQLLTPRQQQERIEAEPFKQAAEQKAADLKAAKEEGRLPETAITKETLTTLHPDLAKTAIGKRVASEPAKYSMNNAEGLNDVVKSLEAISTKKPDLAPSINPFLTNLKKHVEALTGKKPEQAQEVGAQPTAEKLQLPEAFAKPLSDQASQHVADNNFSGLLSSLAETHENEDVKKILNKINSLGLGTKIQTGEVEGAGEYDPNTNTITLNPNTGMNEHTAIHEPVHAAIAHVLDDASHPLTKAFNNLFQQVKSKLGDQYGGTNLQEFASESVSNPEFQSLLKKTRANNGGNIFQRIVDAVARFFGFRKEQSAYDRAFKHINDILDVSHEVPRKGGEKLAHAPQQRTAFDVPEKATAKSAKEILNEKKTLAKEAATMPGIKKILNNIRKATTNQAAFIASSDYQKTMGKLADAQNEAIASVLVDQAYDGDKYAAAAAHTGKVVVTKQGIKVVKDNNNVENVFKQVHALGEKIGDIKEGKNIVNRYLLARRYNNIMRSGKGYVSPEQEQLTKQFIGLNKQYPELNKIADMVDALQHDLLDFLVDSGIYSKDVADQYKAEKGYVPLYRIMNDIEAKNPGIKQYFGGLTDIKTEKAFKGDDREALDVLDNMMTRYMWAVQSGARNFAMQKIAKDYGVIDDNGQTKYYTSEPKENKEFFAPVLQDGKRRWVEYSDPKIPAAVKPVASLGPILSFFSGASRILRTGVTAIPTFGAAQVVMDAQRAALLSGVNRPFELMGRVMKSYYDILKNPNNETIEKLHAHGISGGYGHTTQEITNRMRRSVGLDATTTMNRIWDNIDDFAAASDMAQRKAIYEQTMKETGDEMLALNRARNIINWRHRGDNALVHVVTQVVPFANAYAQSMDVMLSAMMGAGITGKSKKEAIKQFYTNAAMMAGISAIYTMAMSGDDEYEKMSEREKLGSFLLPGTGGVTIPVPSDIGLLYKAIPELAWHYITKDSVENPRDVTKLKKAFGEAFLDSVSGPNLMPQLIKGVVEVETNHNFGTGKPIVGHGMELKEPFKQYGESTSEIAKTIGEKMNWSPVKVDHLIKAYAGTVGSLVLMTTDQLINSMSDVKRPDTHWYKNPMVSRFMADPRYKSQVEDYYDLLERSNIVTNTIADYRKHGDIEGGKEYKAEHKEMAQVRQQVLNLQSQMTKIREQRNKIIDAKGLSAEEKSDKIEALDERTGRVLRNIEKLRLRAGL